MGNVMRELLEVKNKVQGQKFELKKNDRIQAL